jgi:sugar/nucleoside kinase (ribokinase family)
MVTLDLVYVTEAHPLEDSENPVLEHALVVGGPAGRSAIAAGRLGGNVELLAMIGTGTFAALLQDQLAPEPLKIQWVQEEGPSQHSCVLVSQETGLRTTIWLPQPRVNKEFVRRVDGLLRQTDTVLFDCTDQAATKSIVASSRANGATGVVDTGSYKPWVEEVLPGVEHIVVPEKFLSRRLPSAASSRDAAIQTFADLGPRVLGVTRGKLGGLWVDEDGLHDYAPYPVQAIDTCGAGDTFHGAYAWAVAAGLPIANAFDVAAWSAGCKCGTLGNAGIPGFSDLALQHPELLEPR